MASVAALLVVTRIATRNEGLASLHSLPFAERYWADIPEYCPPMPEGIGSKLPGCFGLDLDYASGMASCLEDKCEENEPDNEDCDGARYEADCERENAGELSAAVYCRMEEIEAMRGILQEIPGRRWPPQPFPWPYAEPAPIQ